MIARLREVGVHQMKIFLRDTHWMLLCTLKTTDEFEPRTSCG